MTIVLAVTLNQLYIFCEQLIYHWELMVELYYEKYRVDTGFDFGDAAVISKRGLRDNNDAKENTRRT